MATRGRTLGVDRGLQTRMLITMMLLGIVYGVFIFILWSIGAGFGLIFVSLMVLVQFYFSDRMVLATMRAKIVTEKDQPRLHEMVGRLAVEAGVPKPRVAVADMAVPNAFATGRSQKHAAVAVTTGLLGMLSDDELEGVLAHEMSHIRSRDVQVMTYVSFFAVVASSLMTFFFFMGLMGGMRGRRGNGGNAMMVAYLVTIVVWVVSQILVATLSRYREFAADRGAAALTGRPMELASALERISGSTSKVPKDDLRKVEAMNAFFIMPAIGDGVARLFSTHPATMRRVERLRQMAQDLSAG
jgi:heat shock protein HtpX